MPNRASNPFIVDAHVHIFPDAVAGKAIANLEKHSGLKMATDGTLAGLKRSMAAAGIRYSVTLPVSTRPDQVPGINRHALALRTPGIIPFGSLHPQYSDCRDEIRRLREGGIKGVKMHPDYQAFNVADPAVFPIYEALAEAGLILFLHAGGNVNLPPPDRCAPAGLAVVVKTFPGLKIVAAHLGGWRHWDAVERHLAGLPLWLDLSFVLGYCPLDQVQRIIRGHGAQHFLFGTDSPWVDQTRAVAEWKQTPFRPDEKRAFLGDNAAALLKLPR
jgi:predicted TIM-barrel fold metal-dependent hydrolase